MEYHLEIRRPGNCDTEGCIKTFTSATPFLSIRTESLRGIDPSGAIVHRILLYTESVADTVEARFKSPWNAQ